MIGKSDDHAVSLHFEIAESEVRVCWFYSIVMHFSDVLLLYDVAEVVF